MHMCTLEMCSKSNIMFYLARHCEINMGLFRLNRKLACVLHAAHGHQLRSLANVQLWQDNGINNKMKI